MRLVARLAEGSRVLDVGYAQWPNRDLLREGRTVVGLDLERSAAESGYDEERIGDASDLAQSLGDARFDSIVAAEFIEHLEEPYRFLEQARAHLNDGGRLVLSTPNPVAWPTLLFEWGQSERRFYTEDHTYYFTPRWVRRMLERSGYRLSRLHAVGLWPIALPCPVALSYQVVYVAEAVR